VEQGGGIFLKTILSGTIFYLFWKKPKTDSMSNGMRIV
jgi:hypothetical protein